MPSSLIDVCRFNPTAGGTTDWTYSSAVTGYQSPTAAGAANGATYSYRAESADLTQWEVGTGVYTSGTGVLTRAAVLFNSSGTTSKISFSAVPQVALVALAEDLVRSIAGNAGVFTLGGGITNSGNQIKLALNSATLQANPSNPTGTTSGVGAMMGIGSVATITPVYSSRVLLEIKGSGSHTVSSGTTVALAKYGTGAAPANGAASTGTTVGPVLTMTAQPASFQIPFSAGGIITGLSVGTAYWFDLSVSQSGGTGSVSGLSVSAMEF